MLAIVECTTKIAALTVHCDLVYFCIHCFIRLHRVQVHISGCNRLFQQCESCKVFVVVTAEVLFFAFE